MPLKKKKIFNTVASQYLAQNQNRSAALEAEVRSIFLREFAAYKKADVVLTITDDDKEKMLMTLDQEFDILMRLAYNQHVTRRRSHALSL
jgi:hypothetical protein